MRRILANSLVLAGFVVAIGCANTIDGEPCTRWTSNPRPGPGRPAPVYPEKAARARISGFAEVWYRVDEDGRTYDVRVTKSEPPGYFEQSAIDAISNTRYCSPPKNDEPIGVRLHFGP